MSGYFIPFVLSLGVASVIATVLISRRMDVIDHEGQPLHLSWKIGFYWAWLLKEIFKSAVDVSKVILKRKMPIHPAMVSIKATQRTEMGHVIYANSITLTPGTITVTLENGDMMIHALTREAADGLLTGDMDRRVTAIEGVGALDRLLAVKAASKGDAP
jgi:multicomponent Na+:H+ antiporter subunit E